MKTVVGLALATLATLVSVEAAPGRLNTAKRASSMSTEEKAILPENRNVERNEVLMDRRFSSQTVERKSAIVGERRSVIGDRGLREKKSYPTPDRKEYEQIERKESVWGGKRSRFSTSDDSYDSKIAVRFQDKIDDTRPLADTKPIVSKRASFERVNRFSFRRNKDGAVTVSTAGAEKPSRDISGASTPNPGAKPVTDDAANPPPSDRPREIVAP